MCMCMSMYMCACFYILFMIFVCLFSAVLIYPAVNFPRFATKSMFKHAHTDLVMVGSPSRKPLHHADGSCSCCL